MEEKEYKVTAKIGLQLNRSGVEREPIAEIVMAESKENAIQEYRDQVYRRYVEEGDMEGVEFPSEPSDYQIQTEFDGWG